MECGEKLKAVRGRFRRLLFRRRLRITSLGTFREPSFVGIEHTCREWEVKLNNTIELTFDDKRFALKEYDD